MYYMKTSMPRVTCSSPEPLMDYNRTPVAHVPESLRAANIFAGIQRLCSKRLPIKRHIDSARKPGSVVTKHVY